MFLIVTNLAVYIMETFLLKVEKLNISTIFVWSKWNPFQTNIYKAEVSFYGIAVWTVLSHLSLPLCIFYRHAKCFQNLLEAT